MRIVIDLQGAQTESRFRGIGRYSLSIAKEIAKQRGEHEVIIALSGLFPDTIEDIRTAFDEILPQENIRVWFAPGPVKECEIGNDSRREVAEVLREAFLQSLEADVIIISSLFEGYDDNAITSIKKFDKETKVATILYDLIPYIHKDKYLVDNKIYTKYYLDKIEHFKKADLFLAISESSSNEAIEHLGVNQNKVINISSAVDETFLIKDISNEEKQKFLNKYSIIRKTIVYTPGGFDIRKNFENLIRAYAILPIYIKESYQLIIVSKVDDGSKARLLKLAKDKGLNDNDFILTGYVSDDDLIRFYSLCDLFVFPSIHEGFGLPVLEAMNCGSIVIGSNTTSIPEVIGCSEALFNPLDIESIKNKIQDVIEDETLQNKLREHNEVQIKKFSWDESAKKTINTLENIFKSLDVKNPSSSSDNFFLEITKKLDDNLIDNEVFCLELAKAISLNQPLIKKPTLLIDITQLRMLDYGTGIQRVVRAIIFEIFKMLPINYEISLVYLEHNNGKWQYFKAFDYESKYFNIHSSDINCVIEPNTGDIFLGLDLMSWIIDAEQQGLFSEWKNRGVKVHFVIYDILPIIHPEWWPENGGTIHTNWLRTIVKVADSVISISKAVSDEVKDWVNENDIKRKRPLKYNYFHLGADIENSMSSKGLLNDTNVVLDKLKSKISFLSVGTIEPRKGHKQTLLAFEKLWSKNIDVNLVIVGKLGWMMDDFAIKVKNHKELNNRLFWLEGISDEYLEKVYASSNCLIAASEGEGFGLPLIEAAQKRIPIIARDIPVFKEVAGEFAYYFENSNELQVLVDCIKKWLEFYKNDKHIKSNNMPWLTWKESAKQLITKLTNLGN